MRFPDFGWLRSGDTAGVETGWRGVRPPSVEKIGGSDCSGIDFPYAQNNHDELTVDLITAKNLTSEKRNTISRTQLKMRYIY